MRRMLLGVVVGLALAAVGFGIFRLGAESATSETSSNGRSSIPQSAARPEPLETTTSSDGTRADGTRAGELATAACFDYINEIALPGSAGELRRDQFGREMLEVRRQMERAVGLDADYNPLLDDMKVLLNEAIKTRGGGHIVETDWFDSRIGSDIWDDCDTIGGFVGDVGEQQESEGPPPTYRSPVTTTPSAGGGLKRCINQYGQQVLSNECP